MPEPVDPKVGLAACLTKYDEQFQAVNGNYPSDYVIARMIGANALASMALVHAVRELTAEIRASRGEDL
jgi:hypothetical protein